MLKHQRSTPGAGGNLSSVDDVQQQSENFDTNRGDKNRSVFRPLVKESRKGDFIPQRPMLRAPNSDSVFVNEWGIFKPTLNGSRKFVAGVPQLNRLRKGEGAPMPVDSSRLYATQTLNDFVTRI